MTTDKKWYEDKRAIGLKYKFLSSDEVFNIESLKVYKGILYIDNIGAGRAGTNEWAKTIQLAQGEKTPYEGKGEQPIPDGIVIDVWGVVNPPNIGEMDFHSERVMSHEITWLDVTDYQVQEMPEEKQTRTKIPTGATSAVNAATGEKIALNAKTVSIKQATIDEVVECLEDYKHIALILNGVMIGVGAKFDSTEYERAPIQVDKLIKELKGE